MSRAQKCKAGGVIEFCVSRGVVKTNWADIMEQAESKVAELVSMAELMEEGEPKSFLLANTGMMNYSKISHLLGLLLGFERWTSKLIRFTGLKQDALLNGWIAVATLYEKYNLFLVEPAIELRKVLTEIPQLKKSMGDCLHQLVGLADKVVANESSIDAKKAQLVKIQNMLKISATDPESEILVKAEKFHSNQLGADLDIVNKLIRELEVVKRVEMYNGKFGTSLHVSFDSLWSLRLVLEELTFYQRMTNEGSEASRGLDSILGTVRDLLSQDPQTKAQKSLSEIQRLRKSCSDTKVYQKLRHRETRLREELRSMDERTTELKERRESLIADVRNSLARIFPHLDVDLVFPDD